MQNKSDLIYIKRKSILYFFVILLALVSVTPVLADYLGPNRTVIEWTSVCKVVLYECKYVASKGDWRYRRVDDWACSDESKPWQAYSSQPSSQGCFASTTGDTYWEREETLQEVTNTYPPAIINNTLQNCTLNNGWCTTSPELSINGTEPVSGYNILAIEGSLNGQTFACSNSTCNVPLSEGDNSFTFWALSSWGDSSEMGTFTAKVDTILPIVGLDVSGSNGTNGWYVSPTTLTATGSDSTSGLLSALLSVNGEAWEPFRALNEGVHDITVSAEDNAGNISKSSTTISVDTTTPAIDVSVNGKKGSNGWYISYLDVTAKAADVTSGVGAFEVASDGNTYQAYTTPISFANGRHTIQFKAIDNAGNFTETPTQEFYIDTNIPEIEIPVSWEVGNTIKYRTHDNDSGLASVRVVIEDDDERYAKVAWDEIVSGAQFEGEINWDGKFADGTIAPPSEYLVWIKVSDVSGNENVGMGRVIVPEPNVLVSIFKPDESFKANPIPPKELFNLDDLISVSSVVADLAVPTMSFGGSAVETKEAAKNSLTFISGTASSSASSSSNVLWGTTAAAVIGATTAYVLDAQRKRREEAESQRAEIEAEIAKKEAQKEAAEKARKVTQWLEGQAILNVKIEEAKNRGATSEQIAELKQKGASQGFGAAIGSAKNLTQSLHDAAIQQARNVRMEAKMSRIDAEEDTQWLASQANESQARLAAYYYAARQREEDVPKIQAGWWDKTKSSFQENIAQPVQSTWNIVKNIAQNTWDNTQAFVLEKIYTPYIEPVITILDREVYQPYIEPALEKVKQVAWKTGQWINENVYQPYIKPAIEKLKENVTSDITWVNENLYQPYIKPVVTAINENIYQPYIQPIVTAIDENFYQPYVKPVVDKTSVWWRNTWDKYSEWVHGGLDAFGFVPGLGEIADGINGLIYLGEGRYVEASVSAIAMIPILGDLGKAGKWTIKLGAEVLEEAAEKVVKEVTEEVIEKATKETLEEVAEKTLKETGEELANKVVKESLGEVSEKTVKESSKELANKVAKDALGEVTERAVKEAGEELAEKTTKDVVKKTTNEIIPETVEKTLKDTVVAAPIISTKVSKTVAEETIEESLEQVNKETAQRVLKEVVEGKVTKLPIDIAAKLTDEGADELAEKISKELGGKKVWVSAKSGSIYVSSPPTEGLILAERLSKIDLTKTDEVEKILREIAELTSRGSGNHVVLGPFRPKGAFIQRALDTNGIFWDVGDELWEALEATGIDMFKANDQFLRVHVANGIDRFDVILTNVDDVMNDFDVSPPKEWKDIRYTEKEILDLATMPNIPYQLIESSWVRVDLVNDID